MKNGLPSVLLASTVAGRRPAPGTCWHSEMSPGWGWLLRLERCPKKERYSFVREMHQLAVSTYSPVLDSAAASKMVQNCLLAIYQPTRQNEAQSTKGSVWPDGLINISYFGPLQQWIFVQQHKKFTKVCSQFCKILNKPSINCQRRNILPLQQNFAKSDHTERDNHFKYGNLSMLVPYLKTP